MPRKAPLIPQYPRKAHKSGQARVRIQGRDYYLGPFGSPESLQAFQRLLDQFRAQKMAPITADQVRSLTVAELVKRYLAGHCRDYYRCTGAETTERYERVKRALDRFAEAEGSKAAADAAGPELKAFQRRLAEAGYTRDVVNQHAGCVRRMFRWGLSERLVPAEAVHSIDAVENLHKGRSAAPEGEPVLPADEEAIDKARAALPTRILRDMVDLQLWTGMRPGEVCKIRPIDVDRSGVVRLPRSMPLSFPGCWIYAPEGHKNEFRGQHRLVLLGPRAQAILTPYLDRELEAYCFSPADSERERRAKQRAARRTKVWPSHARRYAQQRAEDPERPAGGRYTSESYCKAVGRACEKAGCLHWHPHQLRHNAATRLAAEFGEEVARIVLGHATAEATKRYVADLKRVAILMTQAESQAG